MTQSDGEIVDAALRLLADAGKLEARCRRKDWQNARGYAFEIRQRAERLEQALAAIDQAGDEVSE